METCRPSLPWLHTHLFQLLRAGSAHGIPLHEWNQVLAPGQWKRSQALEHAQRPTRYRSGLGASSAPFYRTVMQGAPQGALLPFIMRYCHSYHVLKTSSQTHHQFYLTMHFCLHFVRRPIIRRNVLSKLAMAKNWIQ